MLYLCKSVSLLWDKSAAVKAIPPTLVPLSAVMSLLGDQHVATVELGGRLAVGLITHSPGFLSRQLGYFVV